MMVVCLKQECTSRFSSDLVKSCVKTEVWTARVLRHVNEIPYSGAVLDFCFRKTLWIWGSALKMDIVENVWRNYMWHDVCLGCTAGCVKCSMEHVQVISQLLIVREVGKAGNVFQVFPHCLLVISQEIVYRSFRVASLSNSYLLCYYVLASLYRIRSLIIL